MDTERPSEDWSAVEEIDLREYMAVLSRRRGLIYTALAIVFVATLLNTLATTPLYEAETTLQIEPDTPKILNFEDMFQIDATTDAFYQTQYKLIESRALASRVIDQLALFADGNEGESFLGSLSSAVMSVPRFGVSLVRSLLSGSEYDVGSVGPTEDDIQRTQRIDSFLGRLDVSPIRNTRLVVISWSSPSPTEAAEVTRAIADAHIEMNLEAKFATTQNANRFLAREISKLQGEIAEAEAELQRYGSERNILSNSEKQDVVSQSLMQLNQELTSARTDRVQKQATWDSLRNSAPSSLAEVRSNSIVQGLQKNLADLRQQRAELSRRFTAEWPEVQRVKAQMDDLETRIGTEEGSVHNSVVRQARAAYQAALDREQRVDGLLSDSTNTATQINQSLIVYRGLQTTIQSRTSMLESLLERQSETGVSSRLQGRQTSNIRVVDEAAVPLSPSSPNLRLNLMLGLIVGLMLGVGLAFVQEYLDNTLTSPEDVERHLGVPNLALVPAIGSTSSGNGYGYGGYGYGHDSGGLGPKTATETVIRDHPRSSLAEAYRGLRAAVLLSQAGKPPQVVLVSSSQPSEGKTTSSINLAISLAQAGKKTLLIDGDLRRPRIHEILGLDKAMGLVTFLTGAATIERVVHNTDVANLWAIPCGPLPPNPAELLGSSEVKALIEQLRESFDAIVIDSPPVMAVVDALELAVLADGVVLVVKGGETPHPIVERALKKLHDVGAHVLGVLLNNVDISARGYYGGYKRTYYYRSGGGDDRAGTSDKNQRATVL